MSHDAPRGESLESLIDIAYDEVAKEEEIMPEFVWKGPYCPGVMRAVLRNSLEQGVNMRLDRRKGPYLAGNIRFGIHMYGVMEINGEEIIVDPTWQQFLPENLKSEDLPRTLIGARHEAMDIAISAGVEPEHAEVWSPLELYDLQSQ